MSNRKLDIKPFHNGNVSERVIENIDLASNGGQVNFTYDTLGFKSIAVEVHSVTAVGSATITQGAEGREVFAFSPAQTIAITASSTTLNTFESDCESIRVRIGTVTTAGTLTIIVTRKR